MIGIIGAMEIEISGLRAVMENRQSETISGIRFDWGSISGVLCTLAVCGPGKVNAAVCAQTMAMRFHPRLIINSGVAGGIGEGIQINDVVIATAVVQHDMDTSPIGDPVGLISGINLVEIPADKTASRILEQQPQDIYDGGVSRAIIATGDQFIASHSRMRSICEQFHAMACEMEGGSIGQVCYMNQIPFAILRAISDNGNDDAVLDYPKFARQAADRSIALLTAALPRLSETLE